jgi:hypothetical protein
MDGKFQKDIPELPTLDKNRYETLFRIYNVEDSPKNFYYYNITKSIKIDTSNLDDYFFQKYTLNRNTPWTTLSYQLYGTMFLWWLIKLLNPDTDVFVAKAESEIRIIRPEFLEAVLDEIQSQIAV